MTLIRWAVWNADDATLFMLRHSIGTFRYWFGPGARYVVCCDDTDCVEAALGSACETVAFSDGDPFADAGATWRKWAPSARLAPGECELRVDADVFVLSEPTELLEFCAGGAGDVEVVVTEEAFLAAWPFGNFARWIPTLRPVQAGLVAQRPCADITSALEQAYACWRRRVAPEQIRGHDEQGAVAWALHPLLEDGRARLLPAERYRVVCPLEPESTWSIDGLAVLHATAGGHPAFHRFIEPIAAVSGVPIAQERP